MTWQSRGVALSYVLDPGIDLHWASGSFLGTESFGCNAPKQGGGHSFPRRRCHNHLWKLPQNIRIPLDFLLICRAPSSVGCSSCKWFINSLEEWRTHCKVDGYAAQRFAASTVQAVKFALKVSLPNEGQNVLDVATLLDIFVWTCQKSTNVQWNGCLHHMCFTVQSHVLGPFFPWKSLEVWYFLAFSKAHGGRSAPSASSAGSRRRAETAP